MFELTLGVMVKKTVVQITIGESEHGRAIRCDAFGNVIGDNRTRRFRKFRRRVHFDVEKDEVVAYEKVTDFPQEKKGHVETYQGSSESRDEKPGGGTWSSD